jgi:hypothetical protein
MSSKVRRRVAFATSEVSTSSLASLTDCSECLFIALGSLMPILSTPNIQTAFRDPRATAMRDLNDALSGQSLDRSTGQRADRGQLA